MWDPVKIFIGKLHKHYRIMAEPLNKSYRMWNDGKNAKQANNFHLLNYITCFLYMLIGSEERLLFVFFVASACLGIENKNIEFHFNVITKLSIKWAFINKYMSLWELKLREYVPLSRQKRDINSITYWLLVGSAAVFALLVNDNKIKSK